MKICSFLGLCSYYRRFIPKFNEIAEPLHHLTEKSQKIVWSSGLAQVFEALKEVLTKEPILAYPDLSESIHSGNGYQ